MIKFVCHPSGNDLNGGGYVPLTVGDDYSYAGTWSQWHNNFDALVVGTGLSVVQHDDYIKILGDFTNVPVGIMVYCDFTASYADGRYLVMEADSSHLCLAISYTADTTVNVRVGGAIKSPAAACTLAYGTSGDVLLLPANQTTQTVNEVVDEGNRIVCTAEGATLEMYSVDDSTGIKLTTKDSTKWAVIRAAGTWTTANLSLYETTATLSYSKIDKVIFDGNEITPVVVEIGDGQGDYTYLYWGDIIVRKSKSDGYGIYALGYLAANQYSSPEFINYLKVESCYRGIYPGNRYWPSSAVIHIDSCSNCGLYWHYIGIPYFTVEVKKLILSENNIGIFIDRYNFGNLSGLTFVNNTTDIQINKYSTTNYVSRFSDCLFYNDAENGENILVDDDDYVDVELINCVYGATGLGGAAFNGVTPILTNCQEITADPFIDKANGDYRLNPAFADLAKIYDWTKQVNSIGATTPAQPASGGGSGGCFVQAGSGRFGVQES